MANEPTNLGDGNQIGLIGKIIAGLILIFLTTAAIVMVVAYWPDRMPSVAAGDDNAWYKAECFKVTLIGADKDSVQTNDSTTALIKALESNIAAKKDSLKTQKDSADLRNMEQSLAQLSAGKNQLCCGEADDDDNRMHLNTILLLLVALMGFLGNMVHVASSFTSYVGNGTFRRSWTLWYFVKPFTAAGLAVIVYFIIRAGFLSYGTGAAGISLYGILALSALAGLFTDSATLKLKEVFEVIFKPRDDRADKLQGNEVEVSSITTEAVDETDDISIVLAGKNLNADGLIITIDGVAITPTAKTAQKLEMKYTPTPAEIEAGKVVLLIVDKAGKQIYTKDVAVK